MTQNIKVAVIGGTGKSGKYLVKYLLEQGYSIKMLVRNPEKVHLSNPLIEIVPGNAKDYDAVHSLLAGCQAVISTLGIGIPPSEPTIFSRATSHVLRAMQQHKIKRYIVTTGLNVNTPLDKKVRRASQRQNGCGRISRLRPKTNKKSLNSFQKAIRTGPWCACP